MTDESFSFLVIGRTHTSTTVATTTTSIIMYSTTRSKQVVPIKRITLYHTLTAYRILLTAHSSLLESRNFAHASPGPFESALAKLGT
mmetsp:Transcript_30847/g.51250  ORF Transcript_30847/g.51250 Transcript_30847/m.51250 type:complete len:87 (+) Transcript_30847:3-263(+)